MISPRKKLQKEIANTYWVLFKHFVLKWKRTINEGKKSGTGSHNKLQSKISTQVSLNPESVLFTNTQRPQIQRDSVPYIIKGSETWSLIIGLQPFAALAFPPTPLQVLVVGTGRNWVPEEGGEFVKKGGSGWNFPYFLMHWMASHCPSKSTLHPSLCPGRATGKDHTKEHPCTLASRWIQPSENIGQRVDAGREVI